MPDRVSKPRSLSEPSTPRTLLTPLAWMWRAGNAIHAARAMRSRRALNTPVVSIGALTMGGAGKSPMVAHLARRLREMGRNPAILTRGYKRVSKEPMAIVPRGGKASIESTGDEAQMFVRAGDAHVGIGADRYEVGRRMEAEIGPDIFLLDDGFQHVQLHRDHDVVLIDASDPEAGGVFPVGRLREPLSAIGRATEVVVTRGPDISRVVDLLKLHKLRITVFGSRVVPIEWVEVDSGVAHAVAEPKFSRVAAFCGLGEPRSFWRTLEELGIKTSMRREFADHHRYAAAELKQFGKEAARMGVEALVTTEKDAMNLCESASDLVVPLRLYWLKIGIEISEEDNLLRRIASESVKRA
jgi:tetraacyldisaccharide 4'-kinase